MVKVMRYQEYSIHNKVCEYLGRQPVGKFKRVYNHLTDIFDGLECVVEFDDRIVLQKEGQWYFKQDGRNGYFWCEYVRVWSLFFQDGMGMGLAEVQDFIKTAVEEHLRCEVGEPNEVMSPYGPFGQNVRGFYLRIMK